MGLAEGLPVVLGIPEESVVSLMGLDVVDHCSRGYSPFPLAHDAEGIALKVRGSGFLPPGVVASLSG
jgi:hypothetical protein